MPDLPVPQLSPDDLHALVDMGRELGAELDLRALLSRILARACELTDSPDGSVILHDADRNDLYFAEATGRDAAMLLEQWGPNRARGIPIDGSKAGQVYTTGVSLLVQAMRDEGNHFKGVDKGTGHQTQSMVCVPLGTGAGCLGVMQLLNKHEGDYTLRDVVLLEHFASQAAVALRNAKLMDDVLAHMGWYGSQTESHDPVQLLETLRRPARNEELTVMFADMRGFNRLCQALDRPEHMQKILDEFLSALAAGVLAHGGIVNKFLGDGLLAIFRGGDSPVRAVRCALEMVEGMARMRERWDASSNASLDFLDLGIGIATDTVILGAIGTARVRDFTVLGTGVNLAAHLTRDARQGRRILVDKRTYLAVRDLVAADGPEEFELKKPDQPQGRRYERYSISGLKPAAQPSSVAAESSRRGGPSGPPSGPPAMATREGVFISYSHRDKEWLSLLQTHLRPYVRGGTVSVWDDTQIKAGAEWQKEIGDALARARVAVLLVSPHFLESEFVAREEWPALLAAARQEGLTVIWFVVSACSYRETDIPTYQAALDPERALDSLSPADQNRALVSVCQKIKEALAPGRKGPAYA
jgi:class 3 adenylate cyclase